MLVRATFAPVNDFAGRLLAWWDVHGRKDLPWQTNKSPYRVWLSEIMLQQTQVITVIPYFTHFVESLPDVTALAHADLDTVLHLWTGLGYYARARNLHEAARRIQRDHAGELPRDIEKLMALPGIGRSTAHAIWSIAMGGRAPILDGNVKRVLARWRALPNWPGTPANERTLWQLTDELTPAVRTADYTQAIMDLGATLCTRAHPACARCPLADDCAARARNLTAQIPARKPRKALPTRTTTMLIFHAPDGSVLLERRPPTGLWGGLWSFPETRPNDSVTAHASALGVSPEVIAAQDNLPAFTHTFTHYRLVITPLLLRVSSQPSAVMEPVTRLWYKPGTHRIGLTRPVTRLLAQIEALSRPFIPLK